MIPMIAESVVSDAVQALVKEVDLVPYVTKVLTDNDLYSPVLMDAIMDYVNAENVSIQISTYIRMDEDWSNSGDSFEMQFEH